MPKDFFFARRRDFIFTPVRIFFLPRLGFWFGPGRIFFLPRGFSYRLEGFFFCPEDFFLNLLDFFLNLLDFLFASAIENSIQNSCVLPVRICVSDEEMSATEVYYLGNCGVTRGH